VGNNYGVAAILKSNMAAKNYEIFHRFYPRYAMLARVFATATCLSVLQSRADVKTKKASVMISSPSGSPTIVAFWCQISSQNSKGFPRTGAQRKVGWENSEIF